MFMEIEKRVKEKEGGGKGEVGMVLEIMKILVSHKCLQKVAELVGCKYLH